MGRIAPLDEPSRKKLLKMSGKWKGAPAVNTKYPVLQQLETAGMTTSGPAKDREAMSKSGLKKYAYAMPHMHQAARMRMYDRVGTASAALGQLRELVIEPADSTMHSMDARFEAATKEAADTTATAHATMAPRRARTQRALNLQTSRRQQQR
jgi:hypothetical protein